MPLCYSYSLSARAPFWRSLPSIQEILARQEGRSVRLEKVIFCMVTHLLLLSTYQVSPKMLNSHLKVGRGKISDEAQKCSSDCASFRLDYNCGLAGVANATNTNLALPTISVCKGVGTSFTAALTASSVTHVNAWQANITFDGNIR